MTKRHYEAFARQLQLELADADAIGYAEKRDMILYAARTFADVAERDNPRFDRARFMRACGL